MGAGQKLWAVGDRAPGWQGYPSLERRRVPAASRGGFGRRDLRGWGNRGPGTVGAPGSRAIDRPFGHGETAVFGTRDVDTRRDANSPLSPTGPFQTSTEDRTGPGYLYVVTLHPFIRRQRIREALVPTEQSDREASLLGEADPRPGSGALGLHESPTVLERVQPSTQAAVLRLDGGCAGRFRTGPVES
jgi:hypothetical protein